MKTYFDDGFDGANVKQMGEVTSIGTRRVS